MRLEKSSMKPQHGVRRNLLLLQPPSIDPLIQFKVAFPTINQMHH